MSQCMPVDLATKILLSLPVKSLLRLRSVCKIFSQLISTKEFINDHLATSKDSAFCLLRYKEHDNQHAYLLCPDDRFLANWESAEKLVPPFSGNAFFHFDVGYCNGIICLLVHSSHEDRLSNPDRYVVLCNPSTRKHRAVRTKNMEVEARVWSWQCNFGFGFDSVSGEYKLVNIYGRKKKQAAECSLKDGEWRTVASCEEVYFGSGTWENPLRRSVFLNGKCHWLIRSCSCISGVISFDLHCRVFSKFAVPDDLKNWQHPSLQVIRDCLCLCTCTKSQGEDGISLWLMKDYGVAGSWNKVFHSRSLASLDRVIGLRSRGEVVYRRENGQLISYDPVTHRIHNSEANVRRAFRFNRNRSWYLDVYKETLAFLGEADWADNENPEASTIKN